ncbi:LysR family transcriptional regulator [Jatrophihabitans fulvus]
MRIEQLRYLDAIVSCGSMRRAGERLHLSQPALSEAIGNLERELGVTLLERRRSGARISPAGQELLPHLDEVLAAVERLRAAAGDCDLDRRTVRIATEQAAAVPIVAPAVRDVREQHPDVRVEVSAAGQDTIRESVLDGSADLGLVGLLAGECAAEGSDVHHRELLRGGVVVCCRADSPLAARSGVTIADLAAQPFVAMRPGTALHRVARRLFGDRGPEVSYSADGAETGRAMVAAGLGATLLPEYSVLGDPPGHEGVLTWRPLVTTADGRPGGGPEGDPGPEIALVVQSRPSRHRSHAVLAFERALEQRAAELARPPQQKLRPA